MLVKISPVKILSDLGYELVELETPEDYLSALMEAIVTLQNAGGSGRARADILQEELIRVRKERKKAAPSAGMKATKKTISPSKFFDKKEQKSLPMGKGEMGGAIVKVAEGVDSIVETLKEDKKQDKKHFSFLRKMAERFKRRRDENKLEFQIFDGLKKTATAALEPVKSAWQKLLDFLQNVILGRVLFKILEWMGNKDNKSKLESIIKFFKDWWPTLLTAYLLFGNSFGRMAVKLGVMVSKFAIRLVTKLIPKLLAGLAKIKAGSLLKGGLVAGAVVGTTYLMGKMVGKDKEGENIAGAQNQSSEKLQEEGMDAGGAEVLSQSVTTENVDRMTQGDTNIRSNTNMLQTGMDDPLGGGRFGLNKGGTVPGSGNTDTVPAMLTPGEFVMSKGAVQKNAADTLAGMNAAAGGTNRPTLMGGYNEGGFANMTNTMSTSGSGGYGKRYVSPEEAKERLAARGMPSMELFDGTVVPNFGKMGADSFMDGIQLTRSIMVENEADPAKIAELDNFVATNPYAQPEKLQSMINRVVPGSTEQVLGDLGDSITASARMNGGGLVQAFQGGGRVQRGRSAEKRKMEASKITPIKKKKVTVAYAEEKQNMADKPNTGKSGQEIPSFNVTAMRSPEKIKLLGISV